MIGTSTCDSVIDGRLGAQAAVLLPNGKRVSRDDLLRFLLEAGLDMQQAASLMQTKEGIKEAARFIVARVNSGRANSDSPAAVPSSASSQALIGVLQVQWYAQSAAPTREPDGLPGDFCDYVRQVHCELRGEAMRLEAWQSQEALR